MMALVTGGASSGKSRVAESVACSLSERRTYVATMRGEGTEAKERICRHRRQRAGLGFVTVECPDTLATLTDSGYRQGVALLDDLGNLCANALFTASGTMNDVEETRVRLEGELVALADTFEHLVVVSAEVGAQGPSAFESVNAWVRLLGALSCSFAAHADAVVEVVCGIPTFVKGEPWQL